MFLFAGPLPAVRSASPVCPAPGWRTHHRPFRVAGQPDAGGRRRAGVSLWQGESAGRSRRAPCPVRKVRAPQGRVVGNTDPG
jgi:hypothetical protein